MTHRYKLRILYLILCGLQLGVTAMGLAVGYQIQRSYSRNIAYEGTVNAQREVITELETLARAASPERLDLDDSAGSSRLAEVTYASRLFLNTVQTLMEDSLKEESPLAGSRATLNALTIDMRTVATQSELARQAGMVHDLALLRARLTYVDRALARVHLTLGNINQDMSNAKKAVLAGQTAQAERSRLFLVPISFLGLFLVFPALLYARRLNRQMGEYEGELESRKTMLEERVATRTSELRTEIEYRNRLEAFNGSRNLLLERVAEGKGTEEVLSQLASATETSLARSRCLIVLDGLQLSPIAPSVSADFAATLGQHLFSRWSHVPAEDMKDQGPVFIASADLDAGVRTVARVLGFRSLFVSPIAEPQRPLLGVIALLLQDGDEPDSFTKEVLLSASRMAAITVKHHRMQDELLRRAHHDPLTDLPNRILFEDRLIQAIARARRHNRCIAMLCVDLDGFKQVNDLYGHQVGDRLLQEVAQRLTVRLRLTDTVARVGGDEFLALLDDGPDSDRVANVTDAMIRVLAEPFVFGDISFRISASIGVALFPADGDSATVLQRHADLAMYRAKERGGNTYQTFSADLSDKLARRQQLERHMQEALEHDGFELHFQPIYTPMRQLVGLEALIRFSEPDLKSISPGEFIQVAEKTGQIMAIGEWVIREACLQAKEWKDSGFPPIPIALNVSAIQLARPDFVARMERILLETGVDACWLHIEITETAVMTDIEEGGRQLYALERLGVHISVDDFGTGHSSLSYIQRLPIGTLKIDRSFVQQMVHSEESAAIVRAIVAMARALDLIVVAEGVETLDQLDAVITAGCDRVQGYLFGRPLDRFAIRTLLETEPLVTTVEEPIEVGAGFSPGPWERTPKGELP